MNNLWLLLITFFGFGNNAENTTIINDELNIDSEILINGSDDVEQDELSAFYHS